MAELERVSAGAQSVLDGNDRGGYTIPAAGHYAHQVLWDACFIAIGRRHRDVARAQSELHHLLEGQWANGMVPHIVFSTHRSTRYWWDRRIWRSSISPLAPKRLATSGISQPPVLAEAVVRIGEKLSEDERKAWYRSIYPKLLAYHQWFYREHDPDGTGLVVQLHPWETGLDTTPSAMVLVQRLPENRWFGILKAARLDRLVNDFGTGWGLVGSAERSRNTEALELYALLRELRRHRYTSSEILSEPGFALQDLAYNCILIRANERLTEIAKSIGEVIPTKLEASFQAARTNFESLFDQQRGQYYSRDRTTATLIYESTVESLLPLYAGCIDHQRAQDLVRLMEDEYLSSIPFPLPSVPTTSSWFEPKRYWQGPTWLNINWLVIDGLRRYGFDAHADALTKVTIELVDRSGFREYFDPLTGEGAGVQHFSWSAAVTLDLLADIR